jgi:hypothetical protein
MATDFALDEACNMLLQTPALLRALFAGVPPRWTTRNEGDLTWTPFDVVGHLIDGEETDWIPRARIILSQGPSSGSTSSPRAGPAEGRTFVPFDRFRHLSLNKDKSLAELLHAFERLRRANVETLRGFNPGAAQLALRGVHPDLGEVTLGQLIATWVVHDFDHIAQIARTLAKQYAGAVGPWRAFMRVLQ